MTSEEGNRIRFVPKNLLQHIPMLDYACSLEPEVVNHGEARRWADSQLEMDRAEALPAEDGRVG